MGQGYRQGDRGSGRGLFAHFMGFLHDSQGRDRGQGRGQETKTGTGVRARTGDRYWDRDKYRGTGAVIVG